MRNRLVLSGCNVFECDTLFVSFGLEQHKTVFACQENSNECLGNNKESHFTSNLSETYSLRCGIICLFFSKFYAF